MRLPLMTARWWMIAVAVAAIDGSCGNREISTYGSP